MKNFYLLKRGVMRKFYPRTFLISCLSIFYSATLLAQPCPAPTLSAPPVCVGQSPNLILTTALGGDVGPYSLVINGTTYTGIVPGVPFAPSGTEDNLFGNTVPAVTGYEDVIGYELGVKFRPSVSGVIRGIRFYKDAGNPGPFTGTLWTSTGTALATGTFTVTSSGWQELRFTTPVPVTAGTLYVASYFDPNGRYAVEGARFATTPVVSAGGFLTAPASGGADGSNGVYNAGASGFPTSSFNDANYFVDVIFAPSVSSTTFDLTEITGAGCSSTGTPLSSATASFNPLPTGTLSSPSTPTAGQSHSLVFTGTAGTSPFDLTINSNGYTDVPTTTPFGVGTVPITSSYRLWTGSLPTPSSFNDGRPIEVGVKFRTLAAGTITALRFYKGIPNTNPTVLRLYSAAGAVLAEVTHTDPTGTQTGFIEVPLGTNYAATGNTLYITSYYSAAGDYVSTNNYITSDIPGGQLLAVSTAGPDGPNGLYKYDVQGVPDQSCGPCNGPNYWADVVMTAYTNSIGYNLTSITDANGCTSIVSQLLTLSVQAPLPVTLRSFAASQSGSNVILDWSTASESNNRGFEIQRSDDGVKFAPIGFVEGAGNSQVVQKYSFVDRARPNGRFYYRLKQIDYDNRFSLSNILAVEINGRLSFELGQSYPNPTRGAATINYSIPEKANVRLVLYDAQGRVVSVLQNGERAAGKYVVTVPANMLKSGVYYYKIDASGHTTTRKMIVQ